MTSLYAHASNPDSYKLALEVLGYKITNRYHNMLVQGVPQAKILVEVDRHIVTLRDHPDVSEEEKASGMRQLHEWAMTNLGDLAPHLKPNALVSASDKTALIDFRDSEDMATDWMYLVKHCDFFVVDGADRSYFLTQPEQPTAVKEEGYVAEISQLIAEGWYEYRPSATMLTEGFFKNLFSKPTSAIYHNQKLNLFAGHVDGVPFKTTTEKGLFRHLTNKHKFEPHTAQSFIDNVKGGDQTGRGHTTAEEILHVAQRHATLAKAHHYAGNHQARDEHLAYVSGFLDKAHEFASRQLKHNPSLFHGAHHEHHPLNKKFKALHATIHGISD